MVLLMLQRLSQFTKLSRTLLSAIPYRSTPFHSTSTSINLGAMKVRVIPALEDNYMYLVIDEKTKMAAAVDPVDWMAVLSAAKEEGVEVSSVMTTHHHSDHAAGNKFLSAKIKGLTVFGGDERIPAITEMVEHESKFNIGSLSVKCLFTPCHTKGHICYYVQPEDPKNDPVVFTGDTLFIGGCGRFFEGTPEQMHEALVNRLGTLPTHTKVYCGHEYTVSNLKFAMHAEPQNVAAEEKLAWAQGQRAKGLPTVGLSTIGDEFKFNPFMQVDTDHLRNRGGTTPIERMAYLRAAKNNFRPPA